MITNNSLSVASKQKNPYIKQKNNDILREIQSITAQVGSNKVDVRLIYSNNKIINAIVSVKGDKDLKSKISSSNKIKVNFVESKQNKDEEQKNKSVDKEKTNRPKKREDKSLEKDLPYKTYSYYTSSDGKTYAFVKNKEDNKKTYSTKQKSEYLSDNYFKKLFEKYNFKNIKFKENDKSPKFNLLV
ncbi:MAG: hypothetical protein ACQEQE_08735 [Bacillota bacterium]